MDHSNEVRRIVDETRHNLRRVFNRDDFSMNVVGNAYNATMHTSTIVIYGRSWTLNVPQNGLAAMRSYHNHEETRFEGDDIAKLIAKAFYVHYLDVQTTVTLQVRLKLHVRRKKITFATLALAMGLHPRLGELSLVRMLDNETMRAIFMHLKWH